MNILNSNYKLLRGGPKLNMELLKSINQDINEILTSYTFEFNTPEIRAEIVIKVEEVLYQKYRNEMVYEGQRCTEFVNFIDDMVNKLNTKIFGEI